MPRRDRILQGEIRWRPPKWDSRVPATLVPDGAAPRTQESHPSTPEGLSAHNDRFKLHSRPNQEIKSPYGRHNPFSGGWGRNCDEACCAEREHSRIHLRALACEAQSSTAWRTGEVCEDVCEVAPALVAAADVDVDVSEV